MKKKSEYIFDIFNIEDSKSKTISGNEMQKLINTILYTKADLLGNPAPLQEDLNDYLINVMKKVDTNKTDNVT